MKAMLTCRNVTAHYGPIRICRDIDIEVEAGRVLVITGPNGAGKTTFLRRVAGQVAGDGEILLDGDDIGRLAAHERARHGLSTLPESRGLLPELSVGDNLKAAGLLLPRAERAAALARAVDRFPVVSERWDSTAGALSGGEQQMLALARLVLARPKAVLLDEPSQSLAPRIVEEIAVVVRALREADVAVVLVEQHLGLAADVADSVAVMIGGSIVMRESGASLLDEATLAEAYLGAAVT